MSKNDLEQTYQKEKQELLNKLSTLEKKHSILQKKIKKETKKTLMEDALYKSARQLLNQASETKTFKGKASVDLTFVVKDFGREFKGMTVSDDIDEIQDLNIKQFNSCTQIDSTEVDFTIDRFESDNCTKSFIELLLEYAIDSLINDGDDSPPADYMKEVKKHEKELFSNFNKYSKIIHKLATKYALEAEDIASLIEK